MKTTINDAYMTLLFTVNLTNEYLGLQWRPVHDSSVTRALQLSYVDLD